MTNYEVFYDEFGNEEFRPYRKLPGWIPEDEHDYHIAKQQDDEGVYWAYYCDCGEYVETATRGEAIQQAEAHVAFMAGAAISDRWKAGAKTPLQIEEEQAIESIKQAILRE